MLAFLKRRWILLTCAVVLASCSCFDMEYRIFVDLGPAPNGLPVSVTVPICGFGLWEGVLRYYRNESASSLDAQQSHFASGIHAPNFGDAPRLSSNSGIVAFGIPLWLPLAAILGWLVFRELRWREKRARKADANPAQ